MAVEFYRITLSITKTLKRCMGNCKKEVNWSEVVREAIEEKLEEVEPSQSLVDHCGH